MTTTQATVRAASGIVNNFKSLVETNINCGVNSGYPFLTSTPMSPAEGASYSGTNATFYGGLAIGRLNNGSTLSAHTIELDVLDAGGHDRIHCLASSAHGVSKAAGAIILFLKSDFLNGMDSETISLNQNDSNYLESVAATLNTLANLEGRFAVRTAAGKLYVADAPMSVGPNVLGPVALARETFTEMDLTDGTYQAMGGRFLSTVAGSTLTDIDAVGVVAFKSWVTAVTFELALDAFSVSIGNPPPAGTVISIR